MYKKINFALILSILLLSINSTSYAEMKKLAQAGCQFLKIGVGARAIGMGESYIAVGQDANAIFWNPAGLAYISGTEISFSHTEWIADIKHDAFAAAAKFGNLGVFGVSFVTMNYGDIYATSIDFNPSNDFGYTGGKRFGGDKIGVSEHAIGLAYSRSFTNKFSLGGHAKFIYQNLGESQVNIRGIERIKKNEVDVVAFDFGTLYYTGFKDLRIAMSIQNFSKDLMYEIEAFQLPLNYRVGAAMNMLSLFNIDESQILTLSVETIHPRDYTERVHVGAEYVLNNIFAIRAGYKSNYNEESLTAGAGLKTESGLVIDYAYAAFGNAFGAVHRFSIGLLLN